MTRTARILALAGCAALTACMAPKGSLNDTSGPLWAVKTHYERRATEFNKQCKDMRFMDAHRVDVLEETDQRLVLKIHYAFRSGSTGETTDNVRFCRGYHTRIFTLAKAGGRYEVLEMSEPFIE